MIDFFMQEFGKRMGFETLVFENNIILLEIAHVGSLYFEKQIQNNNKELLIYLAKEYNIFDETIPLKVLEYCSFMKNSRPSFYGSIVKNKVVLGVRLVQEEIGSGAELENIIYQLFDKIQEIV